jgi:HJR/Mrr/RecB family endonuclease
MVFEISTIIAMAVYGLIGWVAERLVWILFYKPKA